MSENINDLCGNLNVREGDLYPGRPIAGYHMVKYGETQEYLESLAEAGYMLMYSEDNPPEEGKLTVAKPNAMPEYLKDYATNVVYDEYGNFISCSVEGLFTLAEDNTGTDTTTADTTVAQTTADLIAGLKSYLEEIAPKMNDISSLTDEEVISFNATLKSYKEALQQADVFTYLADTTLDPRTDTGMNIETLDPRTDTSLTALLDSYIAALEEKEANTADTTGADPAGLIAGMKSYLEEIAPKMSDIDSLTDEEVAYFNETLKSFKDALRQADVATYLADTTLDPRTDTGMNPETFDPRTDTSLNDLLDSYIAALDEKEAKTSDTTVTDTTTTDTTDNEYHYGRDNWSIGENGELIYKDTTKYIKFTSADLPFCLTLTVNGFDLKQDGPGTIITPYPDEWKFPVFDEEGNLVMSLVHYSSDPSSEPVAYRWVSVDEEQPTSLVLLSKHEFVPLELSDLTENELALLKLIRDGADIIVQKTLPDTTDTTNTFDLPSGYVFTTEYTEEFEEKLQKAFELYFNTPARRDPDDTRVAFISTVDAETEAVTSVQVACAEDDGWRTIGVLNNADGIDWKYQAGNLTGSGAASVAWHAQELGALGVWTDGTDNWTGIAGWFDSNWTMLGCGDFDGDGKDSVLMSLNGGLFYSVDLDGTLTSLGSLNWSGWEFGAAGDFAGDGKDDIVLFHKELGCVVLLADGNADDYTSIGQLDGSDWNIAGAGDFDGDGRDDLLVRQMSTGLAGAYAGGDMNQWSMIDTTADYYLA